MRLEETIRNVAERFCDPRIGGRAFRMHPSNKKYVSFFEKGFLETIACASRSHSHLTSPNGIPPPTSFPPPSAKERRRTIAEFEPAPSCFVHIIDAKRTGKTSSFQTQSSSLDMEEEPKNAEIAPTSGDFICKPSFIPDDYKLGDPLPRLDIRDHPNWQSYKEKYFTSDTESRFLEFYDNAGPNATNQLARPSEYFAVARKVRLAFEDFFRGQGENPDRKEQGNRLNWFQCTHSEIELCYDKDPKTASFDLVFYVSFVGNGYPPFKHWQDTVKTELPAAQFEPVETFFYVPRDHGTTGNPYHPETVLLPDREVMAQYCANPISPSSASKSSFGTPWCRSEDGHVLLDWLGGSQFDARYFGSFRAFSHNPNFSDPRRLKVGNPEMISREEKEELDSILQKQRPPEKRARRKKNANEDNASNETEDNNDSAVPSPYASNPGPSARGRGRGQPRGKGRGGANNNPARSITTKRNPETAKIENSPPEVADVDLSPEEFSKLNEEHAARVSELPTVSNVGVVAPFRGNRIYLNGAIFRKLFADDLSSTFVRKNNNPVGFKQLKECITSYRLTYRLGGLPYHFLDRRLDPPALQGRKEFDDFYFPFQLSWNKYREAHGNAEPKTVQSLKVVKLPPLIKEEERKEAESMGIRIPQYLGPISTRELAGLVNATDRGSGFPVKTRKDKGLQTRVDALVGRPDGEKLDAFFRKA